MGKVAKFICSQAGCLRYRDGVCSMGGCTWQRKVKNQRRKPSVK